jgi:zinc transport system ATP-binding protein
MNALEIENLTVKFGEHHALEDINLFIKGGHFAAIVGPNGAGKSTLLKTILNLVRPSKGVIKIFGKSPEQISPDWFGYVPQVKTMDRSFPAIAAELVLSGISRGWPWKKRKNNLDKALHALERVGAAHLAKRPLSKLSGGELQRIYLARGIVREPRLIMLDEPATGIDAIGEEDFYKLLEIYQNETKSTIIMVTHDWHVAVHHADKVLLLNRKQVSFGNPKDALKEKNLRVAFGHIGHAHGLKFLVKEHD